MQQLSDTYTLETKIRETPTVDVYRGYRNVDGKRIVAKVLHDEFPSSLDIARIRYECSIVESLAGDGVVGCYGVEESGNRLALILDDAGDISLESVIHSEQWSFRQRLQIAKAITAALQRVHRRQVLHKDVKPHHFFIKSNNLDSATLIDFGIATRLTQEQIGRRTAKQLRGSIAYIAPEQTGRMNRNVDQRSDLYSLGVTLYELFARRLPFDSKDALELIHCHLARTPRPPHELNPEIPPVLSLIILKLLSKMAEDRYQSCTGLQHDLTRCLQCYDDTGTCETFELGQKDVSSELRLPQKLYGRQAELEQLQAAFTRILSGEIELHLISGYSGVGKTALVNELQRNLSAGGYFVSGKFDYLKRGVPYAALAHACTELVRAALAESPEALADLKARLAIALGPNGRLMTDLVPELKLIIGVPPDIPELGPAESQRRFEEVFVRFLSAFTTDRTPLILFLDDLQWADAASLHLLFRLLTSPDAGWLLILGAYRENEVDSLHPLVHFREETENAGTLIREMSLSPLSLENVSGWLTELFSTSRDQVAALARAIHKKTRGNPFFLGQFVKTLADDGAIVFDRALGLWTWDAAKIAAVQATENVVDFMVTKLHELPTETKTVLRLAACIGYEFNARTLTSITEMSGLALEQALWKALDEGIVIPLDDQYILSLAGMENIGEDAVRSVDPMFRFLHDRVQQAAYELLDDDARERAHLTIGRLLLAASDESTIEETLFEVVDHLNRGAAFMTDAEEKHRLFELNLRAGRRARDGAAAAVAVHYLERAIKGFGDAGWETDYESTYHAHLTQAECEYLRGNPEGALALLDFVETHARTLLDSVPARNLRAWLLMNMGRLSDSVAYGVETIRLLGVELPPYDNPAELGATIGETFGDFQSARSAFTIESLADLPEMTDPVHVALLETYAKVTPAAFQMVKELMVLLVLKAVSLLLKHGNGPFAPYFYAQYGLVHSIITGDFETGHRFGELGITISEQQNTPAQAVPVRFLLAGFLSPWCRPLSESFDHFRIALRMSRELGDAMHMNYCLGIFPNYQFYGGVELQSLNNILDNYFPLVHQTDDVINHGFLVILRQTIAALQGRTEALHSLSSEAFDENDMAASAPPPVLAFLGAAMATVRFIGGHYVEALEATETFEPLPNVLYNAEYKLFHCLALVRQAYGLEGEARAAVEIKISEDIEMLDKWAENAPANHGHRRDLARAELEVLRGNTSKAMTYFDQAISKANKHGFTQHQAIANELCARFHLAEGRLKIFSAYMVEAHYLYERWGASAKVTAIETEFDDLLPSFEIQPMRIASKISTRQGAGVTVNTSSRTDGNIEGRLDLETSIRATEAISSELDIEKVIERLMQTLIENAGAQRGVVLLGNENTLSVKATLTADPRQVALDLDEPLGATKRLSVAVARYVARTQKIAVLDNATENPMFKADPYVIEQRPMSVLCIPMLHRGRLTGLFYFENNAAAAAFNPARVELLQFLSAQAAAAVENARLYSELNRTNEQLEIQVTKRTAELKRALDDLWSEMDLAKKIQTVLLPSTDRFADLDVASLMIPADQVGGDYYDIIETEGQHWIVIGDVSGHGLSAGLITMMIQTAIQTLLRTPYEERTTLTPADLLSWVNLAVRANLNKIGKGQYMTATAIRVEGNTLQFSGLHQDLLVFRAGTKAVERIETNGTWIGLMDDISKVLENQSCELQVGDCLLLYTDGVTDHHMGGASMIGIEGLMERFGALARDHTDLSKIISALAAPFQSAPPEDDVTLLALRYAPSEST